MLRSRVRLGYVAVIVIAIAGLVVVTGGGVATAAPIPGGVITTVCTGTTVGSTFTLTQDCGDVTTSLTVPPNITTVDGANHTITATDIGFPQFSGAVLTNQAGNPGPMNIQNLRISGVGFQVPLNCPPAGVGGPFSLNGIFFDDASGSISGVTVQHIFQGQTASPSCQTGRAILAIGTTAPRTVTITNTTVTDYQKNGIDGRGLMTMNVSGSTIGRPRALEGLIAQNGLVYVGSSGTATNNTIYGSGDQQPPGPPGGGSDGTAVTLFGANNVTITNNTITGAKTDIGVAVVANSTGIVISFNRIGRTAPDVPDPTGIGVLVGGAEDSSTATLICNTFSGWRIRIVGAIQIGCRPLRPGVECHAYSATMPAVIGGRAPFTWSRSAGALPPGLHLLPSGAITGTPTKASAGIHNFTGRVVDSSSTPLTATQRKHIRIRPDCIERLTLTKTADRKLVVAGETVRFTITVRSVGQVAARHVLICDRLPPHMTFVSAPGARFIMGRACWSRKAMRPGAVFRKIFVARVDQTAPTGRLRNVVVVTAHSPIRLTAHADVLVQAAPPPPPPPVTG